MKLETFFGEWITRGDQASFSVTLCLEFDALVCGRRRASEIHGTGTNYAQSETVASVFESAFNNLPKRSVHPTNAPIILPTVHRQSLFIFCL